MKKFYLQSIFLLSAIFFFAPFLRAQEIVDGKAGSQSNPVTIASAFDFKEAVAAYNSGELHRNLGAGANAFICFRLTADISLANYTSNDGWTPLGNLSKPFYGHFDGGGFTISGLYINSSSAKQGLFGVVAAGSAIQNIALENCNITGSNDVGGIAGENNGTIQNCSVSGAVEATSQTLGDAGGIAGYNNNGTIVSCLSTCSVKATTSAGGIAGKAYNNQVTNCAALNQTVSGSAGNTGHITGNNTGTPACISWSGMIVEGSYANGKTKSELMIAGTWPATLKAAPWTYEAGKIPSLSGSAAAFPIYMTGLAGTGTGSDPYQITSWDDLKEFAASVNQGKDYDGQFVKLTADIEMPAAERNGLGWEPVNGFAGTFDGNQKKIQKLYINRPDAWGVGLFGESHKTKGATIKSVLLTDVDITGHSRVGGLIGQCHNSVINACYVDGNVVSTYIDAAGIAGGAFESIITECYSKADITGVSGLGGIVVHFRGGLLQDCYTTGTIHAEYSSSVGGVAGHMRDNLGVINRCYSTAVIICDNGPRAGVRSGVGGVAGLSDATSENLIAINQSIDYESGAFGHVVGAKGVSETDLTAWGMMPINGGVSFSLGHTAYSANSLKLAATWSAFSSQTAIWSYSEGQLPILKNIPADLQNSAWPSWLNDNYDQLYNAPPDSTIAGFSTFYYIRKASDLAYLSMKPHLLKASTTNNNKLFVAIFFEADIDLSDYKPFGWVPISAGSSDPIKNLTVAGNGHIISNMYITNPVGYDAGLFGYLEGSLTHISDLHIENAEIYTSAISVGGIVGQLLDGGTISKCSFDGIIENTGGSYSGGIAGELGESENQRISGSTVEYCAVRGNINNGAYVGGIVGRSNSSQITGCYNLAAITGSTSGGIAGYIYINAADLNAAGLYSPQIMADCYSRGDIYGSSNTGGLAGVINLSKNYNSQDLSFLCSIKNCYNTGAVTSGDRAGLIGSITRSNNNSSAPFTLNLNWLYSLGKEITGTTTADPIVGVVGSSNNYSPWDLLDNSGFLTHWEGMSITAGGAASTQNLMRSASFPTALFYGVYLSSSFFPDTSWETATGKMPILKNGTVARYEWQIDEMPFHLQMDNISNLTNDTIRIYTPEQLVQAAKDYPSGRNGHVFLLMNDIDMANVAYERFGTFSSTFNGQGYAIKNLFINIPGGSDVGLFSSLTRAGKVENLAMIDCYVRGRENVGTIAGRSEGEIKNSYAAKSLENQINNPNSIDVEARENNAGGIVGNMVAGASYTSYITNCYSAVNVKAGSNAGGIVGSMSNQGTARVERCFSAGNISADAYAGGIVGYSEIADYYLYDNTVVTHSVSATIDSENAGRIFGYHFYNATTDHCYAWNKIRLSKASFGEASKQDGISKTLAELAQKNTWANFTTAEGWNTFDGSTPYLSGMKGEQYNYLPVEEDNLSLTKESDTDFYLIHNADELKLMADLVNNTGGYWISAKYKLANDIDMAVFFSKNENEWEPVEGFEGEFNGNGMTITNFDANYTSVGNAGLFGTIETGAYIYNFAFEGTVTADANCTNAGLIAALLKGQIENITLQNSTFNSEAKNTGGIAGQITGGGQVNDCTVAVSVQIVQIGSAASYMGGIAGYLTQTGAISACAVGGTVRSDANNSASRTGGIAGYMDNIANNIEKSRFTGNLYAVQSAGGIAGEISNGTVQRCFSNGNIEGIEGAGGITYLLRQGIIHNCYTQGEISGKDAGGIVAQFNNSGNSNAVIEYCYSISEITGTSRVAGIAAYIEAGKLQNCVALNSNISGGSATNRVTGSSAGATLSNNYGLEDMKITVSGTAGNAGTDVPRADCWEMDFWRDNPGFAIELATDIWQITGVNNTDDEKYLPFLRELDGQNPSIPFFMQYSATDYISGISLTPKNTTLIFSSGYRTQDIEATLATVGSPVNTTIDWYDDQGFGQKESNTTYRLTIPDDFFGTINIKATANENTGIFDEAIVVRSEIQPTANGRLYVKKNNTGSQNGSSWDEALCELSYALEYAMMNPGIVTEIWVAEGTYLPLYNSGNSTDIRDRAFILVSGVKLYGSFAGDETDPNQRQYLSDAPADGGSPEFKFRTELSGDFNNDDGDTNGASAGMDENAYHVVVGIDIPNDGNTLMDGFIISGGNANGYANNHIIINSKFIYQNRGGAFYNENSSPVLNQIQILGNRATRGAGMYNANASSPLLTQVTVSSNEATTSGAGIYNENSSPILNNVGILSNEATEDGGAIYNADASSPELTSVFIGSNKASGYGGGMYNASASSPVLTNTIFSSNLAKYGGGIFNNAGSLSLITSTTFLGNQANFGGGLYNNSSSPVLTNITISKNNALENGGAMYNLSSSPVLTNVTIADNTAENYGGGIYNYSSIADTYSPEIRNSIIWGNTLSDTSTDNVYNNNSTPVYAYSLVEGEAITAGEIILNVLPLFADSANGDYRLQQNSPAIDAGNSVYFDAGQIPDLSHITTDLAGNLRLLGSTIDLGAYEFKSAPTESNFTFSPASDFYDETAKSVTVAAAAGATGMGTIVAVYYNGDNTEPVNTGIYEISIDVAEGTGYSGILGLILGNFEIEKGTPVPPAMQVLHATYGQTLADIILPAGFTWDDASTSVGDASATTKQFDAVYNPDPANYNDLTIQLQVLVDKIDPTVTWPSSATITYGQNLSQASLSGGSGAGTFAFRDGATMPHVSNSNTTNYVLVFTPADANYNSVEKTDMKVTVNKAELTVTARNVSMPFGTNPATYAIGDAYDITGFVNNETEAVLTTKPKVSIDSSITSDTPTGDHPGVVIVSGASAANYDFSYVFNTLTITQATGSYIVFDPIEPKTYGDAPFNLSGRHILGKALTFSSNNAIVEVNNSGQNWTATIKGAGTVTLTATFAGDSEVAAETATQTIVISKAQLTITARAQDRPFGQANPDVSDAYDITGYINASDENLFTTLPKAEIDPQYDANTPERNYPDGVLVSGGEHPYYTLNYVYGSLTITAATGDIFFTSTGDKTYGDADFNLTATHAGGNTVMFESQNPDVIEITTSGNIAKGSIRKAGTAVLRAYTHAGNSYQAAETFQTVIVNKADLTIRPYDKSRDYGEDNPAFTLEFSGFKYGELQGVLGTVDITTTADAASPVGTYDIVASGAVSDNYNIIYNPGVLTVYKGTPTPPSVPVLNATYGQTLSEISLASYPYLAWLDDTQSVGEVSATAKQFDAVYNPDPANYNDLAVTLEVLVSKTGVTPVRFPVAGPVVYDPTQTLKDVAFKDGLGSGAFVWQTPDAVPLINNNGYVVIFTPNNAGSYDYSNEEGWDDISQTIVRIIALTVTKGTPATPPLPQGLTAVYGQTLGDVLIGSQYFRWADDTESVGDVSADGKPFDALYNPDAINYNDLTVQLNVLVTPAAPVAVIFPSVSPTIYDPAQTLADLALSGGSGDGSFAWADNSQVPVVNNPGYTMIFVPNDVDNYDYSNITDWDAGSKTIVRIIQITVNKATPAQPSLPQGLTAYSNQLLAEISIGDANFRWTDPMGSVGTADSNPKLFDAYYNPDPDNYNDLAVQIEIMVNLAPVSSITFPTTSVVTYNPALTLNDIALTGGTGNGTFEWTNSATVLSAGTTAFAVIFTPNDADSHDYSAETGWDAVTQTITRMVVVTIDKATPATPAQPATLSAIYGQTLADVSIGDAAYRWNNSSISVGDASATAKEFAAVYNPDPNNFNDLTVQLKVLVGKAAAATIIFPAPAAITYNPIQTLGDIILSGTGDGTFEWADNSIVPVVTNTGYEVVFMPSDANNYDYSNMQGWDEVSQTVIRKIALTVRKADPSMPSLPTLTAITGQTLANVLISDTAFRWKNPSVAVGDASATAKQFDAIYNPDPNNYNDLAVQLSVVVKKAIPVLIFPETSPVTYSSSLTLASVPFENYYGDGAFVWQTPDAVPEVNNAGYAVIFTPADTDNYDYSGVQGWNEQSKTIVQTIELTVASKQLTTSEVTIEIPAQIYNGQELKPAVTIKDNGTELIEGVDYTATHSDNTDAGQGKVTIIFQGNYTGTIEEQFTINKADPDMSFDQKEYEFIYGDDLHFSVFVIAPTKQASAFAALQSGETVAFWLGDAGSGTLLGIVDIVNNIAMLDIPFGDALYPGAGEYTVTAVYNGNNNLNGRTIRSTLILTGAPPDLKPHDITIALYETGDHPLNKLDILDLTEGSTDFEGSYDNLTFKVTPAYFDCTHVHAPVQVSITATDSRGISTTKTAWVTVIDDIAPVAVCRNIEITLDESGQALIFPADVNQGVPPGQHPWWANYYGGKQNDGSYDACGIDRIFVSKQVFTCEDIGENKVILTVYDPSGNYDSCEATVTVYEQEFEIGDFSDILVAVEPGICETAVDYPAISASGDATTTCGTTVEFVSGLGADGIFPLGTTTETWKITNSAGYEKTISFDITIETYNAAPTIDKIADVQVVENSEPFIIELSGISHGIDCKEQQLEITVKSNNEYLFENLRVDYTPGETAATLHVELAENTAGEAVVTVIVTDDGGAENGGIDTVEQAFSITVKPAVHNPVAVNPVDDVAMKEGETETVNLSDVFEDAKGEELTLSVALEDGTEFPEWVTFDAATGVLTLQPTEGDAGEYVFEITAVNESGGTASTTFNVEVKDIDTSAGIIETGFAVELYPNPADDRAFIGLTGATGSRVDIAIYSFAGAKIFASEYPAGERITLDLNGLPSGTYLVEIKNGGKTEVKKLVVK